MEAILLAGGKGTRLQSVVSDVPKVLAPVGGKPFLDYLLTWLEKNGVKNTIISIGYKGDLIKNHYGANFGTLNIEYCEEESPLGTGGAMKKALSLCQVENICVLNGDSFFAADLATLLSGHISAKADVTLTVKEMHDYDRYGTVELDNGKVTFREKQHTVRGFVNCGVYILRRDIFHKFDMPDIFSFENDFLCKDGLNIHAIPFDASFIDIGVAEDYALAQSLVPQWFSS